MDRMVRDDPDRAYEELVHDFPALPVGRHPERA
jgi:hypothetical protein